MTERYARHRLIPDWGQAKLQEAVVVIAGVGAVGNEVARLLAMAGVGKLILCDFDRIELSNLSRTGLFRDRDVGRLKVEAAADALQELSPELVVEARPYPLVNGVGLAELRDASLTLGCLDSRAARLQLSGRCQLVGAPLIDGGTRPWGGEVRSFLDPDQACFGCTLGEEGRGEIVAPWSCLDEIDEQPQGASVLFSALIGGLLATLTVRHLMGLPTPAGALRMDRGGTTRNVDLVRDPSCPFHAPLPEAEPIGLSVAATIGELNGRLLPGQVPLAWAPVQHRLECRSCDHVSEAWGVAQAGESGPCPACGGVLIPRGTLELGDAPSALQLRELGVAPCEILAVRGNQGIRFIEIGCEVAGGE